MKLAALIVAFLLVVAGCLSLVFWGFLTWTFDLRDLLVYLVIAVVALLLVRFAGRALDRQFGQSVDAFIRDRQETLSGHRGMLRAYVILLVTLVPLLAYLEALTLYAALAIGGALLLTGRVMPISLVTLLLPVLLVLGAAIAILSGLLGLLPSRSGIVRARLAATEHPGLWALTWGVAERMGTRPITQIELVAGPGIAVAQSGNLVVRLLGFGGRKLILGIPSIYGLGQGELEAILAHEYGHFNNRDTQWFSLTQAMGTVLTRSLSAMPAMSWDQVGYGGSLTAAGGLNPLFWHLRFFGRLFFQTTRGYSRFCEFRADQEAIKLYGGQTFSDALLKISVNDLVWREYVFRGFIEPHLREGQFARNLASLVGLIHKERVSDWTRDRLRERALKERVAAGPYDTHPPLALRLDVARRFPSSPSYRDAPVQDLFDRYEEITTELTKRYYRRLVNLDRERQYAIAASVKYRRSR